MKLIPVEPDSKQDKLAKRIATVLANRYKVREDLSLPAAIEIMAMIQAELDEHSGEAR